jgi:type III secretion system YscQ/HrcQ family protein
MAPLSWIRKINALLPELNTIPLFGESPSFDWQKVSAKLASELGISQFNIQPKEQGWKEAPLHVGLGSHLITIPITITPLGVVFWMMSKEDMIKLTSWAMKMGAKPRALSSEILQEGFYRYLLIHTLDALQATAPFNDLTLTLSEEELTSDVAFCMDIEVQFENNSCWGRLVIPKEMQRAWVQHFSIAASEYVPREIAKKTPLVIGIQTGSVILQQEEWDQLKPGDVLLLDKGSYDAVKKIGTAVLMLQSTPLFHGKISQNKIDLLDYAFYYEDTMEPPKKNIKEKLPSDEGEVVAIKELPLYVTVEIARLKITLDQLMHLAPGNMLELPIHPDQSVFLTINGEKVGKAELVHLGDHLGLRIQQVG